jgi:DNA-binding response OmpR family regulator
VIIRKELIEITRAKGQFFFAGHVLDTKRRELRRGLEPIAVEPQVFDLPIYLLENRDRLVSKDDLIASVRQGRIVSYVFFFRRDGFVALFAFGFVDAAYDASA